MHYLPPSTNVFLIPAASSCLQPVRCCQFLPAACSLLSLLPASCQLSLLASFHFLCPLSILFSAPASVHTHPLIRGLSLSRGETYWLRHSGKPRASSACTPARFQLYLHPLYYLPPSTYLHTLHLHMPTASTTKTVSLTAWGTADKLAQLRL